MSGDSSMSLELPNPGGGLSGAIVESGDEVLLKGPSLVGSSRPGVAHPLCIPPGEDDNGKLETTSPSGEQLDFGPP